MNSQLTTSPFPGFDKTFKLGDKFARGGLRADIEGLTRDEELAYLKGRSRPLGTVVVKRTCGSKPYDLIFATRVVSIFIHDRVVAVLRACGATGWETFPVEIYDAKDVMIPDYHGLVVTGRCGSIERWRSEVFIMPPPVPKGKAMPWHRGLFFDPLTWDGTDVFTPNDDSRYVFIAKHVKQAMSKAKIKNVVFTALTDFETMIPSTDLHLYQRPKGE